MLVNRDVVVPVTTGHLPSRLERSGVSPTMSTVSSEIECTMVDQSTSRGTSVFAKSYSIYIYEVRVWVGGCVGVCVGG